MAQSWGIGKGVPSFLFRRAKNGFIFGPQGHETSPGTSFENIQYS
jgi:hypothetical protein